jgi:hypothetical protein
MTVATDHSNAEMDSSYFFRKASQMVFDTVSIDDLDVDTFCESFDKVHEAVIGVYASLSQRLGTTTLPLRPAAVVVEHVLPLAQALPLVEVIDEAVEPAPAPRAAPQRSMADLFGLQPGSQPATKPIENEPRRRRADKPVSTLPKLPRKLQTPGEALGMDSIICLEDGRTVKDLGAHLKVLGITESAYLDKWKLARDYPMKAPSLIQKSGHLYEYDPISKKMIKAS